MKEDKFCKGCDKNKCSGCEYAEKKVREDPYFLRDYLKECCTGKENAMFSHELEGMFLIPGRDLRRIISLLRKEGEPICSDYHKGYYYAENQDEVNKTVRGLNEHVTGVHNSITALRNAQVKKPQPNIGKIRIEIIDDEGNSRELVLDFA